MRNLIFDKLNIKFTKQEIRNLILWLSGHSLKKCSTYLSASEKTIANHRANISMKMQALPIYIIFRLLLGNDLGDVFACCEYSLSKKKLNLPIYY